MAAKTGEAWDTLYGRVSWIVEEFKRERGIKSDREASPWFGFKTDSQLRTTLKRLENGKDIQVSTLRKFGEMGAVDGNWLLYGHGFPTEKIRLAREAKGPHLKVAEHPLTRTYGNRPSRPPPSAGGQK